MNAFTFTFFTPVFCTSTWNRYELLDCARLKLFCCFLAMTFLLLASFTRNNMCYFLWESINTMLSNSLYVLVMSRTCFWPVWLNSWVFVYELSGCGFKFSCSHLNYAISFICYLFLLWSLLFDTKIDNKEKSFCWGKLPFCQHKLPFCWQKFRTAYFVLAFFFASPNYHFTNTT